MWPFTTYRVRGVGVGGDVKQKAGMFSILVVFQDSFSLEYRNEFQKLYEKQYVGLRNVEVLFMMR